MENIQENENVVRLAKPQRKGILRLIFSRFLLIFLLLALEVGLIVYGVYFLDDKFPNLVYIWRLFSVLMIIYLFNCPMDSSAKLSWMLLISFLPIAGTGILLFTQSNLGQRTTCKLIGQQIKKSRGLLVQPENVIKEIEHDRSGVDDLCTYLNRSGHFPLYDRTGVTYFPTGEDKFRAMLEELEKAEKFIFMEYFIVEEGYRDVRDVHPAGRLLETAGGKGNQSQACFPDHTLRFLALQLPRSQKNLRDRREGGLQRRRQSGG